MPEAGSRYITPAVRRLALALLLTLVVGSPLPAYRLIRTPPSYQEAESIVFGRLLAYRVWDGVPHVLFEHEGRIVLDHLAQDPLSIELPPVPRWQLSGKWYSIPATGAPASIGVARCTGVLGERCTKDTELFGQINAPEIVALEVQYEGARERGIASRSLRRATSFASRASPASRPPTAGSTRTATSCGLRDSFRASPLSVAREQADDLARRIHLLASTAIRVTPCCDRQAPGRLWSLGLTRSGRKSTIQRAIGLATSEWPREGSG